jgi:hypothetical protein
MSINFVHPSGQATAQQDHPIDVSAARRADRACCCTAKPVVIALMPATADRPHETDLLLCGHHYRVSRRALAAAGAVVAEIGEPAADDHLFPMVPTGR